MKSVAQPQERQIRFIAVIDISREIKPLAYTAVSGKMTLKQGEIERFCARQSRGRPESVFLKHSVQPLFECSVVAGRVVRFFSFAD
jgi:hypothetical protein